MDEERMTVEEKIQSLLEMGFGDESNIRRQLTRAKNDLSIAVAYLTEDDGGNWVTPGPLAIRSSETAVVPFESENFLEFPETHLYDLIDRAGGQSTWNIPYQRHESLGVLLAASTKFLEKGQLDGVPVMQQFIFQVLPDCIEKLTISGAVSGWKEEIVTGVFDMLTMTVELISTYVLNRELPSELSKSLVNIFDKSNKFFNNTYVRNQKVNKTFVQQNMNNNWITPPPSNPFSLNLSSSSNKEHSGWLIDLINHFAAKNGFESLSNLITSDADYISLANCLAPFSILSDILTPRYLSDLLSKRITAIFSRIASCDDATLKSSNINSTFETLRHLHRLFQSIDNSRVAGIENCYFDLLIRMCSLQNFGTRMNALQQFLSLFEAAQKNTANGNPMLSKDLIIEWLNKSPFLKQAMSSNLDQAQYCERLGKVLENMGTSVSENHLKAVCDRLQNATNDQATENIANLLTVIIPKTGTEKLKQLLKFLHEAWETSDEWSRSKILRLFEKVALSTRYGDPEIYQNIVECVWNLAIAEAKVKAPNELISQILDTHFQMIRDHPNHSIRLNLWRQYANCCLQNMRNGLLIYLSARQLATIIKPVFANSYLSKEMKTVLKELEEKGMVQLLLEIIECSVGQGGEKIALTGASDESQLVNVILELLRYISSNSDSYIQLETYTILWAALVDRDYVSLAARNHVFKWLRDSMKEAKMDTKRTFFSNHMLSSIPKLCMISSTEMIECFRDFFIYCNVSEANMIENVDKSYYVCRPGMLVGMDCAWFATFTSRDDQMAKRWADFVIDYLVNKLKPQLIHDCNIGAIRLAVVKKCLRLLLDWLPEKAVPEDALNFLTDSEKAITDTVNELAPNVEWLIQVTQSNGKTGVSFRTQTDEMARLQLIRSLEYIAHFISFVDSHFYNARLFPSHQISFVGAPVTIHCMPGAEDTNQSAFDIHTHSNELFGIVRSLVAKQLETSSYMVDARYSDGIAILPEKDSCLLASLNLGSSNVVLKVKKGFQNSFSRLSTSSSMAFSTHLHTNSPSPSTEKLLIGVGLSKISSFYQFLYSLLTVNDRRLASTAMQLLQILPTDPSVSTVLSSQPAVAPNTPSGAPMTSISSLSLGATSPSKHSYPTFFSESSLECLLNASLESPLSLLYNLQALSANLMPVSNAVAPIATIGYASSAHSNIITLSENQKRFCSHFIQCDGLQRLAELLHHPKLMSSEDIVAKQESFRLVLRLMKHLLRYITEEQSTTEQPMEISSLPGPCSLPIKIRSSPGTHAPIVSIASRYSANVEAVQNHEMFESLIKLCGATISGKLHSSSVTETVITASFFSSSSISTGSENSSVGTPVTGNNAQMVPRQLFPAKEEHTLTTTDVELTKESLELCMLFLRTRPSLYVWFCNQSFASEFLISVLVSCPSATIRQLGRRELLNFASSCCFSDSEIQPHPHPIVFLIDKLLKARVPFWSSSCIRRGPSQRLFSQSSDYFDLLANLIRLLASKPHLLYSIPDKPFNPVHQIEYETEWLDSFTISSNDPFMRIQRLDDLILAGHINLISAWLSFPIELDDSRKIGHQLIPLAFESCLLLSGSFFSSFKTQDTKWQTSSQSSEITPKCSGPRARHATLDLIVALARANSENIQLISDRLSAAYTILSPDLVLEHFKNPVIPPKSSPGGFVGLKNAGATCYMNAVIQQLFMIPKLSESLMSVSVPSSSGADNRSLQLVFELQKIFAYFSKSDQQYYIPEGFWRNFSFTSASGVNVREHQDAFDFFTTLIDTVDEALKKTNQQPVLAPFFQGHFIDEKICEGCPHRFRTDCSFLSLSLPVSSGSLEQSLQQYVKSERLEGENAYLCEKCQAKRNAVKRLALKQLPPVLCIQLKRFYYDWERGVPQKYDTHFTFPWTFDIEPFTEEGISRHDSSGSFTPQMSTSAMDTCSRTDNDNSSSSTDSISSTYQLTGIVVHSGQSNAGHYYSLIRDRRQNNVLNPNYGQWFKFNDTEVKEFLLDNSNIEHECFGGTYHAPEGTSAVSYSGERIRSWSAYLLFYEHVEAPSATARYAKRTKMSDSVSCCSLSNAPGMEPTTSSRYAAQRLDSLAELLQESEKSGLFRKSMPDQLMQQIAESNAHSSWFLNLHDDAFAEFIKNFLLTTREQLTSTEDDGEIFDATTSTVHMLTTFLFSILLPAFPSAINEKRLEEFKNMFDSYVRCSKLTASSGILWLSKPYALMYTKMFLLDSWEEGVRRIFQEFVLSCVQAYFTHFTDLPEVFSVYFSALLRFLPDSSQTQSLTLGSPQALSSQFSIATAEHYFRLLYGFFVSSPNSLKKAINDMDAIQRLLFYLMVLTGNGLQESADQMTDVENASGIVPLWQENAPPINAASATLYRQNDLSCDYLHRCLAALFCGCDMISTKTEFSWNSPIDHLNEIPVWNCLNTLPLADNSSIPLPQSAVPLLPIYVSELVAFASEIDNGSIAFTLHESAFVHICTGAEHLSNIALQCLLTAIAKAPMSHLRPVIALLQSLLRCKDSLHPKRVQAALDGYHESRIVIGLLEIINDFRTAEDRRAYQAMKIICEVSTYSDSAKKLVAEREASWTGAVDWLNDVLSDSNRNSGSGTTSTPVSPQLPLARLQNEGQNTTSINTKSFIRTESACSTLEIARNLLRPPSSDTSSTVTQMIDSPPNERDSPSSDKTGTHGSQNQPEPIIEEMTP